MRAALGRQKRPEKPIERAKALFIRRSSRQPDSDNLVWGFKAIRDLLQPPSKQNPGGLGLIESDDPAHFEAEYRWEPVKRGRGGVRIEVSEAPSASSEPEDGL